MRKSIVLILLFLLNGREAFTGGLPWPAVVLDRLYLPFALEWFADGSGKKRTGMNMVMLYCLNSKLKGWWDEVTLLVWGASTGLLAEDDEVQMYLRTLQEAGVEIIACKKCAENLGAAEKLENLGVKVFYTGQYLTEKIQSGHKILSV